MKRLVISLISLLAISVALSTASPALAVTPTYLGGDEAKRAAKKALHGYCLSRGCTQPRVKTCERKSDSRLNCNGSFKDGSKTCTAKIEVESVEAQRLELRIYAVKCKNN